MPSALQSPFRADLLQGKVALVTGGATGICYSIAKSLGRHGARLVIMGRRADKLKEALEKFKALGIEAVSSQGDVRDFAHCTAAVQKAVSTYGRLDILVNGAAGNFVAPAEELSPNAFKTVIEIDLIGTFNMSRAAFSALKEAKSSVIINISATLHHRGTPWQVHPGSAKAGVDAMTKMLACEWGEYGIRVVALAPGVTKNTEASVRLASLMPEDQAQGIPLARTGSKRELGHVCCFLASPSGSYITGIVIVCDGGQSLFVPRLISRETIIEMTKQQRAEQAAKKSKL